MRTRDRRAVHLAVVVVALTGCYRLVGEPALPPPIRLAAVGGFRIEQPALDSIPAGSCVALRAEGAVASVSGDTIHLARVKVLRQPMRARPCPHSGPSFVVVSAHSDLRAEVARYNEPATFFAIVFGVLFSALFILLPGAMSS